MRIGDVQSAGKRRKKVDSELGLKGREEGSYIDVCKLTFPRGGCTSKKNWPCMYQLACLPK